MKRKLSDAIHRFKRRKTNSSIAADVSEEHSKNSIFSTLAKNLNNDKSFSLKKLIITPKKKRKSVVFKREKSTLPPFSPFGDLHDDKENSPFMSPDFASPSFKSPMKTPIMSPNPINQSPFMSPKTPTAKVLFSPEQKNSPKTPKRRSIRHSPRTPNTAPAAMRRRVKFQSSPLQTIMERNGTPTSVKKRTFEEVSEITEDKLYPYTFKLNLCEGRNLTNTGLGFKDFSNPYVQLEVDGQKQTSKVQQSTLCPQWNQTFHFIVNKDPSDDETIERKAVLKLYDHDDYFDHAYMGKVEVDLNNLINECDEKGASKVFGSWVKVEEGQGELYIVYKMEKGLQMQFDL